MKKLLLTLLLSLIILSSNAQQRLTYQIYSLGSNDGDTSFMEVKRNGKQLNIHDVIELQGKLIPGIATETTYVDYEKDSAYLCISFNDGDSYYSSIPLKNNKEYEPLWLNCIAWGKDAEKISELEKGTYLIVGGKFEKHDYNGKEYLNFKIIVYK